MLMRTLEKPGIRFTPRRYVPRSEAGGPPFRAKEKRGLLGLAEPSLMHGGRTIGEYSEAFVAFDVPKTKHAVAIADGGRGNEVRFVGEVVELTPLNRIRNGLGKDVLPW